MKNILIVAITLGLICASCNYRPTRHTGSLNLIQDLPIRKEGNYISKERNLVLNIQIKDAIILYTLSDTKGRILYKNQKPDASDVQQWSFIMDSVGNLWLNSSDIGLFRLKRISDTSYSISGFGEREMKEIPLPKSVYENLPGSTKDRINRLQANQ